MQALLIFFCAALFYALAFFFLSFSIQKCHKSKRQLHTITKLLSVNYRFATQTYTGCLTNLETSNTKTYNTKVVDPPFLFLCNIWKVSFGQRKQKILTPKYRLLRNFWVTNRLTSNTDQAQITTFSGILTIDKVVDNFTSFPESTRTQKSEFVCERYQQNTELDRDKSEPDVMTGWKRTR